jgi:glycosyltransferase involved in cell wall biosynthesis
VIDSPHTDPIRLLVILEGTTVSGPAKNLLEFCRVSRSLGASPSIVPSVAIFVRKDENRLAAGTQSNELIEAASALNLEVHCIQERFPFDPWIIPSLRNLVQRLAPDIIQTHFVKSHFLVRVSRVWRRCPWIAFHHGYTTDAKRTLIYNQLDRWSLRVPSRIITVCQAFERQLSSRGAPPSRIRVLHNGISQDWLNGPEVSNGQTATAHDNRSDAQRRERVVLAVGRLSEEKAFTDLVVAMDKLRQLRPGLLVRLLIAGEGPERARIEKAVRDLKLEESVRLVGYAHDVRPYYRMADALAISSLSEGSPNALLEAMAAGIPIVATAVGGIPEIVTDRETALLTEPRNSAAMASALDLVLSDSQLAASLVRNARERIKSRHSPEARALFLLKQYEEIHRSK